MFDIVDNSIILADANLHLPLYDKILKMKGNTLSIKVMSLNAFTANYYPDNLPSHIEILYQYKERLQSLSKKNAFFSSKEAPDFLNACLSFIAWAYSFNFDFSTLKDETQKEKDLKEVINLIKDIPLKESYTSKTINELKKQNFSNVYILRRMFTDTEYIWIRFLLENNAHMLENDSLPNKHYFTCSNARTQASIVAKVILENKMNADDIQIAATSLSDTQVLCQMFDHHKIPYTILNKKTPSNLSQKLILGLTWLKDKSLDNFKDFVLKFYQEELVKKYFDLFPFAYPETYPINQIEYHKNSLIDEFTYQTYQNLEVYTKKWLNEHNQIFAWNHKNILDMINELKEQYPQLSSKDLTTIKQSIDLITQAKPFLRQDKDLDILIDSLNKIQECESPETYQGVLIGTLKDITPLKKTIFILSAEAKDLNVLSLKTGIFDEAYIQDTKLPSLRERIDFQIEQFYKTLDQITELYVISPQSTYQSKTLEKNMQIEAYMNMPCEFIAVHEHSRFKTPQFELSQEFADKLYLKHKTFVGSISRLETFAKCPLKHFIRYGLYLKENQDWQDIRIRGTILHHILETLTLKYKKDYVKVNVEQIHEVIENEFQFAKMIFPNKEKWIDAQIQELQAKTELILEQLAYFEKNWHMNIFKQEQKFSYSIPWRDMSIELYGYIDRIDTSKTSFCIFDYKSSDKDLRVADFENGTSLQLATYTIATQAQSNLIPTGSFYISLKSSPVSHKPLSLNYRKKIPESTRIEIKETLDTFTQQKKLKGWAYQDITTYCDKDNLFTTKKESPSFEELRHKHTEIVTNLTEDILSGNIRPDHDTNACDYCAYRMICRNARNEVIKPNRTNKEDQ